LIFRIELPLRIVSDCPDRPNWFALDVERNQQSFLDGRSNRLKIEITPFNVSHQ
jgi:hypothetical protein